MEVVASLSEGRTVAAQCGLFTNKSVPVIFEPPCIYIYIHAHEQIFCNRFAKVVNLNAKPSGCTVDGVGQRLLAFWDYGFDSSQ